MSQVFIDVQIQRGRNKSPNKTRRRLTNVPTVALKIYTGCEMIDGTFLFLIANGTGYPSTTQQHRGKHNYLLATGASKYCTLKRDIYWSFITIFVCVCVRVLACVRARARVCVCVCVLKQLFPPDLR